MPITLNEKQRFAWTEILTNPKKTRILFDGGARSGKTFLIVQYLFLRAFQYPGSRQLMARKSRSHAKSSLWNDTLKKYCSMHRTQGILSRNETELTLNFYNGSSIVVGGLDDADRTEKILGNEYITVFLNEATQLSYETMQMAVTRLAQRVRDAKGGLAVPKLIIDCNPKSPRHWLHYVGVRHVDPETEEPLPDAEKWARLNWSAYDNRENLPAEFLASLEALPEIARDRMLKGIWRDNEGLVYSEFDEDLHVVEPFEIPSDWTRIRAIDFGYTNPFVCLWGALDHDNRLYLYREIYESKVLTSVHAENILRQSEGEKILYTVADHDAEERAELEKDGIPTVAAKKEVFPGIQQVKQRLLKDGSGRPSLFVFSSLRHTLAEFSSYEWLPASEGRNAKEEPKKENDHAMDALRYLVRAAAPENTKTLKSMMLANWIRE